MLKRYINMKGIVFLVFKEYLHNSTLAISFSRKSYTYLPPLIALSHLPGSIAQLRIQCNYSGTSELYIEIHNTMTTA